MNQPLFISYSREDAKFAQNLETGLSKAGISTWRDKKRLKPGDDWPESIAQAVDECRAIIIIISPNAVHSKWVKRETHFAFRKHKPIIPIVCQDTELPPTFDFAIGGHEMLDFANRPYKEALGDLVGSLKSNIKKEPSGELDEKPEADVPAIHVEDVKEFIPFVPRLMLWRFASISGGLIYRTMVVFALRPFNIVAYYTFWFVLLVVAALIFIAIQSEPLNQIDPFGVPKVIFAIAVLAGLVTLFYAVSVFVVKRLVSYVLPQAFAWLPYRPIQGSPSNKLLDHWDSTRPIVWQLLNQPEDSWGKYISSRCRDPALRARVYATVFVLTTISS